MALKYTTIAAIENRLYAGNTIDTTPTRFGQVQVNSALALQIAEQVEAAIDNVLRQRGVSLPLSGETVTGTAYDGLQTYFVLAAIVESQVKAALDENTYQAPLTAEGAPIRKNWNPLTKTQIQTIQTLALHAEPTTAFTDSALAHQSGRPYVKTPTGKRTQGNNSGLTIQYKVSDYLDGKC